MVTASACPRDGACNIRSARFIPAKSSHQTRDAPSLTKAPARWGGQALAGHLRCYSGWGALFDRPDGAPLAHRYAIRCRFARKARSGRRWPGRFAAVPARVLCSTGPSHRRCADSYAARLRRDGAPLAHRYAMRCRFARKARSGRRWPGGFAAVPARCFLQTARWGAFSAVPTRVLCSNTPPLAAPPGHPHLPHSAA